MKFNKENYITDTQYIEKLRNQFLKDYSTIHLLDRNNEVCKNAILEFISITSIYVELDLDFELRKLIKELAKAGYYIIDNKIEKA